MKVRKAVIPAAGLGTRFLPVTKAQPKEMICIVDKPAIQYIVEEALASGIEEILIIMGRNKESIANHFDKTPELDHNLAAKNKTDLLKISEDLSEMANIHFVRQKEAKGLGHAVLCAKAFVGNEPFAVLLGDDIVDGEVPALKQLMDAYETHESSILGVQHVAKDQVDKYGIVDGALIADRTYEVKRLVEKPSVVSAPSNVAALGRYILTPEIFEALEKTPVGKGGEIQLTDGMDILRETQKILAYDFSGKRYDTGDKLGYLKATVEFALKHEVLKDDFKDYVKALAETL
ncbi:MAG: UTP--glucose-1-phosphate uridylyltransferase GalU [Clostridia bacterium]|nr:UTP--glucose-1-phosphate uridylyltransferase GalU [Clostridia bacterium]